MSTDSPDDPVKKKRDVAIGCVSLIVLFVFIVAALSMCSTGSATPNAADATNLVDNNASTTSGLDGSNNKVANAAVFIQLLQRDMHDPASLQLQDVRFADDGTFCAQFRGKNALGATVLDTVVIHKMKEIRGANADAVYDRYCMTSDDLSAAVAPLVNAQAGP